MKCLWKVDKKELQLWIIEKFRTNSSLADSLNSTEHVNNSYFSQFRTYRLKYSPRKKKKIENLLILYKQITFICSNYIICAIICITLFIVMNLLPLLLTTYKYDYSLPKGNKIVWESYGNIIVVYLYKSNTSQWLHKLYERLEFVVHNWRKRVTFMSIIISIIYTSVYYDDECKEKATKL